ncbi:MAG: CoA transferase [Burkholderiales bacterium]|nr:CoA transferase [Burkholderiales bacterium]
MGPLTGIRVVELEGIGPGPFCGMLLADMGADVILIDRVQDAQLGLERERRNDTMFRGRRSLTLDLKSPDGIAAALAIAERADALIEGFRPGVLERLGLGPDVLLARNPRLVIGRMTGWGQDGPMAPRAGHDIDYIALAGVLHAIGRAGEAPVPPLNLVGDFGGGGLLLAFGIACALLEARVSGQGQVVDAAMVEGAGLLTTMLWGMRAAGHWRDERGVNALDTGAPWYDSYATRDGKHYAIGAIEPKFYAELVAGLGLDPATLPDPHDRARWPELRARFAAAFATRTRDEWDAQFATRDACAAPVLSLAEAARHPHARARKAHIEVAGVVQPAPAPRLSRTPGRVRGAPPERGQGGGEALRDWGFDTATIARLRKLGAGWRDPD